MEEKEKVQPTSEPNPNGDEEVKVSDIEDDGKGEQAAAENGEGQNKAEDHTETDEGKGSTAPAKQDRKTDAKFAEERRRRKEREEQKQKEREDEIRRQAVFDVKKEQVKKDELSELGLEKIEDDDDLFLVETFRKAKADGEENPQATAYRALRVRQLAARRDAEAKDKAAKDAEERQKAIVAKDQAAFKAKFGKTTAEVMKTDTEFMDVFGNLIDPDRGNFTELYSAYTSLKQERTSTAKKEGAFPTNPPASGDKSGQEEDDEDFKKRWIAQHGHW